MRVAAAAAAATGLNDVIELAAEAALEALPAGALAISRWERDTDAMRVLINVGELGPGEERFPDEETYPLSEYPAVRRLMHTATPYFTAVDDPDAEPKSVELLRRLDRESDIGVPIVVEGEVWGEVWASTCPLAPRFRAEDIRFLEALAGQLAGVIGRAELFSDVSRLAYEDELTGLANRRRFEQRLESACERWRADLAPVTLLVCDVDELKAINDARGHHAGDRALRRVATALRTAAAPYPAALPARLSGDEFAMLLEGHDVNVARDVAETTLRLLSEDRDIPLGVSSGAASTGPGIDTPEMLLRTADTAQYAAKRRSGVPFCTAGATPTPGLPAGDRRRSRRWGSSERLDEVSEQLLKMLDGEMAERPTLDRLELVAATIADTINAAGWTISFAEDGASAIRSLALADDRDSRLKGIRVGPSEEVYELADYPQTAKIVEAGGGSFLVDVDDRDSDGAERRLLLELGFQSVLAATAADADGVFLVELYADVDTGKLSSGELRVQLLARAAAGRSAGSAARKHQLRKRTRQLEILDRLGVTLAGVIDEEGIAEAIAEELAHEFGCPFCGVVRKEADGQVALLAARGVTATALREGGWRQPSSLGLIGRALRAGQLMSSGDVRAEPDYRSTSRTDQVRSELCAPVQVGDETWGAINLESGRMDAFDQDDARLVAAVARQAGAALEAARHLAQLESAYLDTAEALTAGLEAKDLYGSTRSHPRARMAEQVGRALGMDSKALGTLRFGAALRDIGKLGIPEALLAKPGALDPSERAEVEQHAVVGEQMIASIGFLAPVRPLLRHSHERWDGRGYPDGLAGEEIPLGARIVFACDAYEAMVVDRPYRRAMTPQQARAELQRGAGTQFDPDVVAALLTLLDA